MAPIADADGNNGERERERSRVMVTPRSGVGEIGKNMYVVACGDDMVPVDCDLDFPGTTCPASTP